MKSEKAITLIALVITIIILIILTFTLAVNINPYIEQNNRTKFVSDIQNLKEEIEQYYSRNKELPVKNKYTNISMLDDIKNPNDNENYFVIDIEKINIKLNFGKDYNTIKTRNESESIDDLTDVYIINEQSHTIYYPKGTEFAGNNYYKLEEEYSLDVKNGLYEQVEYIESTGAQYIDTEVIPNQDTSIEFVASTNSTTSAGWFGGRNEQYSKTFSFWNLGHFRTDYSTKVVTLDDITIEGNHIYKIYKNKNKTYIDDELYVESTYETFTSPSTLALFGVKTYKKYGTNEVNSVDTRRAKIRLYSCKIWDDEELIRDYIPVISNEENHVGEACLFDKVENKFYYNQGTGNFIAPQT